MNLTAGIYLISRSLVPRLPVDYIAESNERVREKEPFPDGRNNGEIGERSAACQSAKDSMRIYRHIDGVQVTATFHLVGSTATGSRSAAIRLWPVTR